MKKTININLGGQPFIIDEPAYDVLHGYFDALRQKFTNENEQKEILSDIEGRIAEIFAGRLGKTRAVVAQDDVDHVIALMGRPEDIAGDPEPSPGQARTTVSAASTPSGKSIKKLFRDPDNKKVGGVISGLCYYFGWGDPTWVRIALVAIVLISGYWHIGLGAPIGAIYLILLIVVPEAASSADRLQMRGQPVTIQNIEKEVKDAMHTAASSVDTFMKSENVGGRFSQFLMRLVKFFGKTVLIFVLIFCLITMFILVSGFMGLPMFDSLTLHELLTMFLPGTELVILSYVGLFLLIAVPLISVMYDVIRTLTHSEASNPIARRVMGFAWALGIMIVAGIVVLCVKSMSATDTVKERIQLVKPRSGLLHLQMADTLGNKFTREDDDDFLSDIPMDGVYKTAAGFGFTGIKLEVVVSPDSNYYFEKVFFSRGSGPEDVDKNIHAVKYKFAQAGDSVINLDNKYILPTGAKWRSQKMKLRIYVPEGAAVTFADNTENLDIRVKDDDYIDDHMLAGKILHVTGGKIKCTNCIEKMIGNDDGMPEPPEAPEAPEAPNVKGHFSVTTDGKSEDLKNVTVDISSKGTEIRGTNGKNENVHVKVNDKTVSITKTDSIGHKKQVSTH